MAKVISKLVGHPRPNPYHPLPHRDVYHLLRVCQHSVSRVVPKAFLANSGICQVWGRQFWKMVIMSKTVGWKAGLVAKMLAVTSRGPGFRSQHPCSKLGIACTPVTPAPKETETKGQMIFAGI